MLFVGIVKAVERLKKRYNEDDPFVLCALMGIKVLLTSMGTSEGYTIMVIGHQCYLFFERNSAVAGNNIGRWFVERK